MPILIASRGPEPVAPAELPKTGSMLPLIGLLGTLSFLSALADGSYSQMFLISREFGKASAKMAFSSFVSDWCGKSFHNNVRETVRWQVVWFDGLGLAIYDRSSCSNQMLSDRILNQFGIALDVKHFHDAVFVKCDGSGRNV